MSQANKQVKHKPKKFVKKEVQKKVWKEKPKSNGEVKPQGAKKVLAETTERHNAIEPLGQSTDGMTLPAVIQDSALQQLFQTTVSYLFAFGAVLNNEQSTGAPATDAFEATAYLIDGMINYATGSIDAERMPKVHAIFASMLRQRSVRFRYGNVIYTPTINQQSYSSTMTLGNGDIFLNVPPDTGSSTSIVSSGAVITPNKEAYARILSCYTRKECPLTSIIDITALSKIYRVDPSAFARSYAYVGSNGVTEGGLINDAELEIPFKMPSFSKFVVYDPADTQIARILKLQSGGPSMNLAYSLTDKQFQEQHYKNPIPTIYKFLDLNELYLYVATWMARAMSQQTIVGNTVYAAQTLPMSKYDFLLLLRQAVLSQFTASQLQGQFVQPVNQSSPAPNLFKPLVLDPATVPTPSFAGFYLPSVYKENLSMLKQASYVSGRPTRNGKSSPLRVSYVPVWGYYTTDEIADVIINLGEEVQIPLFQKDNVLPTYSSITDLRTSNVNIKVNPNCQLAINLLQKWNELASSLNNLTQVSSISSDVNYAGNLLIYTRVQEQIEKTKYTGPLKVQDPSTRFIKDTITVQKGKSTELRAIEQALLYTRTILSVKPVPSELNNNLFALILPTLRLDLTSQEDKMTQPTWQTYTGEVAAQPYEFGQGQGGISMTSRAYNTAGKVITSLFAPSNEQDSLAQSMQELAKHSWGADLFGQIASGLLGLIPVVGPALGQVASAFF